MGWGFFSAWSKHDCTPTHWLFNQRRSKHWRKTLVEDFLWSNGNVDTCRIHINDFHRDFKSPTTFLFYFLCERSVLIQWLRFESHCNVSPVHSDVLVFCYTSNKKPACFRKSLRLKKKVIRLYRSMETLLYLS